jgi:hypothetical protein
MPTDQEQIQELKARLYAAETALAHIAQTLHVLFKGDIKIGENTTQRILEEVKGMPGGSGTL